MSFSPLTCNPQHKESWGGKFLSFSPALKTFSLTSHLIALLPFESNTFWYTLLKREVNILSPLKAVLKGILGFWNMHSLLWKSRWCLFLSFYSFSFLFSLSVRFSNTSLSSFSLDLFKKVKLESEGRDKQLWDGDGLLETLDVKWDSGGTSVLTGMISFERGRFWYQRCLGLLGAEWGTMWIFYSSSKGSWIYFQTNYGCSTFLWNACLLDRPSSGGTTVLRNVIWGILLLIHFQWREQPGSLRFLFSWVG